MGALAGTEAIQAALWSMLPKERDRDCAGGTADLHDDGQIGYGHQPNIRVIWADMAVAP